MTNNSNRVNRRAMLRGAGLGVLAAPALVGKGLAAGDIVWRVQSHWPKASSSFTDSLGVLASELEERTDGGFKLELLGAGEFAKGPDIYNLIRKGVVPMGTLSPSYIQDKAEAAGFLYGIPGTFRESWEVQHAAKNLGLEDLVNEQLVPDGVLLMSEKSYPTEMVVSKPINTADDFKGLKIRSSGTMLDYLQAAGAAPQYIPGSELYQSLSSGVVDGAHWGAAIGAQSMSLWEVCKYHMKPALGFTIDAFIVNVDALEGLPPEYSQALVDLMEIRFFQRSAEYMHKEAIALAEGIDSQGVQVMDLPPEVIELLTVASQEIMASEAAKGPLAEKARDIYVNLMTDLGYV
ncbi:TRAP transporter substrate-binding protein DctP [Chachezhania sediminis]|uniref:TRAP transporter substrate-binding protein DctP n=1 Tax=Chachezhania sediminis TaxID=2599291 RepID=UPI001E4AB3CD|nr:TRAP transporter substrate-binding protein DctP [Chachezhania sediminis]